FCAVAAAGAVSGTVPASLSEAAVTPVTVPTAFSTPFTQLLQQRWTPVSFTVLSARAKVARAEMTRRVRRCLCMVWWNRAFIRGLRAFRQAGIGAGFPADSPFA